MQSKVFPSLNKPLCVAHVTNKTKEENQLGWNFSTNAHNCQMEHYMNKFFQSIPKRDQHKWTKKEKINFTKYDYLVKQSTKLGAPGEDFLNLLFGR